MPHSAAFSAAFLGRPGAQSMRVWNPIIAGIDAAYIIEYIDNDDVNKFICSRGQKWP